MAVTPTPVRKPMILHDFFRSSAAYRVRIALNMKGVKAKTISYDLREGAHRVADYVSKNPQGLVPALELDSGDVISQSLAIIEWLNETIPEPPLLPADPLARAKVRGFSLVIAADTHPVQKHLALLDRVRSSLDHETATTDWTKSVARSGLETCEALIASEPGPFCFGPAPTLADICLVPQMATSARYGVDFSDLHRCVEVNDAAKRLTAFIDAAPENHPDRDMVAS